MDLLNSAYYWLYYFLFAVECQFMQVEVSIGVGHVPGCTYQYCKSDGLHQ